MKSYRAFIGQSSVGDEPLESKPIIGIVAEEDNGSIAQVKEYGVSELRRNLGSGRATCICSLMHVARLGPVPRSGAAYMQNL